MQKTFALAENGRGYTSPNPVVGALLVKDNKIISDGYHQKYGKDHAEVVALKKAGNQAEGSTLYVNLEPCSIYGKTPPCADAVIKAGIREVFIGMLDPNPKVNGNGVKKLREAGIKVNTGILEKQARELNRGFISAMERSRPWLTLKLALTTDGYIGDITGKSQWITSDKAREFVKDQRNQHDSVMVGIGTVFKDDPSLLPQNRDGFIPRRIVIDDQLLIPYRMKLVSDTYKKKTLIVTTQDKKSKKTNELNKIGVKIIQPAANEFGWVELEDALKKICDEGISSIYCEGGGLIAGSLITQKLIDELQILIAPKIIGEGIFSFSGFNRILDEAIELEWDEPQKLGPDILLRGKLL